MTAAIPVAFVVLIVASGAFAQTSQRPAVHPSPSASIERMLQLELMGSAAPPAASSGPDSQHRPAPPATAERSGHAPGGMPHDHGMMHRMHHGPEASKGARFSFERGGTRIDLKCDDDEPMRACAEAAIMLIDKLAPAPAR